MSQLKLTADGGGGTVSLKGPSTTTGNAAIELTVPGTGTSTVDTLGRAGNILQVVQTVKKDVVTTTSASFAAISGLSASITPSSASNKILINLTIGTLGSKSGYGAFIRLYKDGSNISGATATTVGSRNPLFVGGRTVSHTNTQGYAGQYLDTAGSTSSITYQPYWTGESGFGTLYLNTQWNDPDGGAYHHSISSITLMEVAA